MALGSSFIHSEINTATNARENNSIKSIISLSGDNNFVLVDRGAFDSSPKKDKVDDESEGTEKSDGSVYYGNWTMKDSVLILQFKNNDIRSTKVENW